jgi:hypothetical protein
MSESFKPTRRESEITPEFLGDQLARFLKGVKVEKLEIENKTQREIIKLEVTDREKWVESLPSEKMLEIFGQSLVQAFGPRDQIINYDLNDPKIRTEALESLREGDFSIADSIYIIAEQGKLIAFLAGNDLALENGESAYFVDLAFTVPEKRNQGHLKQIYTEIFKDRKYQAVLGTSVTPGAVKQRLNVGKQFGYDNFFMGYLNGDLKNRGTLKQQEQIKKLSGMIHVLYVAADLSRSLEKTPEDYVVIRQETEPMPPPTAESMKFKQGEALDQIFKQVLSIQEQYQPDSIYGFLISLRQ